MKRYFFFKIFISILGIFTLLPGLPPLFVGLLKGGLFTARLNNRRLRINKTFFSKTFQLNKIQTITYRKINLSLGDGIISLDPNIMKSKSSYSVDYEFVINNRTRFRIGEFTGLKFIKELEKRGKEVRMIND